MPSTQSDAVDPLTISTRNFMIVQSHPTPKEAEDQTRPAAVRLEESLRDLVHEEMGLQRAAAQRPTPSRTDAFWLFLCVADAALLLWLLPDEKLSNKKLELIGKLVTWIGGSLFVLGYVWFRDLFLAYVRNRSFKITLAVLPFFLVPLYVTRMDVLTIAHEIKPSYAELEIDKLPAQKDKNRLSLRTHDIIVRVKARDNDDKEKIYERPFTLRPGDVWRSWWNTEKTLWPVDFPFLVHFNFEGPQRIELTKDDRIFDPEFRKQRPKLTFQNEDREDTSREGSWREDGAMTFNWPLKPGEVGSIGLKLPYGKYQLIATFADREGCEKTAAVPIMAKPGVEKELISVRRICK